MAIQVTTGFGIRVGGHDTGITFPTIRDAEDGADSLFAHGYTKVEIFRRLAEHQIARVRSSTEAA